jgi:uncharacterized protein
MHNFPFPWGDNRRFNSYLNSLKRQFGGRVQKLTLDAGFTCPNRDGTAGTGGCTFCSNEAFNPSYCRENPDITTQIEEGIKFHKWRYRRANRYIAYFQSYSNTYASVSQLEKIYYQALSHPEVVGLVIGTRPDCIDKDKIELLSQINKKAYLLVEYGVESCFDDTLKRINRGHDFQTAKDAIIMTAEAGIKTGAHIILGLPGDCRKRILQMPAILSALPLSTLKLHQLQIFKDTAMEAEYNSTPAAFDLLSMNDYIETVIEFVERLSPDISIERISGEAPPRFLANEGWGLIRSDEVLRIFERKMEERGSFQGKLFNN